MATIDEALTKLQMSSFRAKFHLSERDRKYIEEKGIDKVREHAADFVSRRLAPAVIPNDGKQTPMRGHPVFVAQHACACCCRGCLNKWYKVPIGTELTKNQQERIVNLLMAWIEKQIDQGGISSAHITSSGMEIITTWSGIQISIKTSEASELTGSVNSPEFLEQMRSPSRKTST